MCIYKLSVGIYILHPMIILLVNQFYEILLKTTRYMHLLLVYFGTKHHGWKSDDLSIIIWVIFPFAVAHWTHTIMKGNVDNVFWLFETLSAVDRIYNNYICIAIHQNDSSQMIFGVSEEMYLFLVVMWCTVEYTKLNGKFLISICNFTKMQRDDVNNDNYSKIMKVSLVKFWF